MLTADNLKFAVIVALLCSSVSCAAQFNGGTITTPGVSTSFVCGPPSFNCASSWQLDLPNQATAPFISSLVGGSPTTCAGDCQNAVKEDTSIPGHMSGTEFITRITDGRTIINGGPGGSVGNLTCSGGDNDRMISVNGTYLGVAAGGVANIFQLFKSGTGLQVVNSGVVPSIRPVCPIAFSWLTDTRLYSVTGSVIHQIDIAGNVGADTVLVDLMAPGICPGVTLFTVTGTGILGLSTDDDKVSGMLQPGAQGSADWTFVWSKTQGCATANWKTGQSFAFCKAPATCDNTTAPVGTFGTAATNCWGSDGSTGKGIHDTEMSGNGQFLQVSTTGQWSQGGCGANPGFAGYPIWQVATGGNQWCQNQGPGNLICGGHQSMGVSDLLVPGSGNSSPVTGPTIHPNLFNVATFKNFFPWPVNQHDNHCSWAHTEPNGSIDDSMPWVCAGNAMRPNQGNAGTGGCTSSVYCPKFLAASIYAVFPNTPNKVVNFSRTFACAPDSGGAQCTDGLLDDFGAGNSIGIVSPKGDFFCWVSTMFHQLGVDNRGSSHPRADAFCMLLQ